MGKLHPPLLRVGRWVPQGSSGGWGWSHGQGDACHTLFFLLLGVGDVQQPVSRVPHNDWHPVEDLLFKQGEGGRLPLLYPVPDSLSHLVLPAPDRLEEVFGPPLSIR